MTSRGELVFKPNRGKDGQLLYFNFFSVSRQFYFDGNLKIISVVDLTFGRSNNLEKCLYEIYIFEDKLKVIAL